MSIDKSQLGPSKRRRPMQEAFLDQNVDKKEQTTMFNIRMNSDLHRRFKTSAFNQDRSMKSIIEELLRDYLDERKE